MKRDGANKSLWQASVSNYDSKHWIIPDVVVDVLIVGGGITGISTGLELQKAGRLCMIIEKHNIGFGTTGGTTSHINTFLDTSYDMVIKDFGENSAQLLHKACNAAIDMFNKNVQWYNIDCGFSRKDGYVYAADNKQAAYLDSVVDASKKAGCDVEYASNIPLPVSFIKAAKFANQAQIHPAKYIQALAGAFEHAGGYLVQNCMLEHFNSDALIEVKTNLGTIRARKLIFATHIPPGINVLHFRCAPYRSYAMAVKLNDEAYPDALAYDMYEPYHYYRTHEVNGEKYLIAGGEDHKTGHENNADFCFTKLENYISKFFDIKEVSYKWSSQYYEPADGLAYIGRLPGFTDNVYVATGYSGNGITYSHIAAIILRDLITTGVSEYAKLFSPNRIGPVAGFKKFVKENADVVKEFIGRRLSREKIENLSEIAKGEGRVVKYEGESIALYRDEEGGLHAINPLCTHARCIVQWNSSEKSWDCPCHGARYTANGEVLTGPATKALAIVSLAELVKEEGS